MQQLSGLDATFLYLETAEMPMHVGALHVFELPPGFPGRFVTALRKHIASRLPVAPVLQRRLWWMPLNMANPAWVDAEPDLRQHIVEIKLPKGAGLHELEAEVSRLHPVLLDRDRPLWKMHVFEGLAAGRRTATAGSALYTQLHHAAVDGQAAVALANAILDVTPQPRAVDGPLVAAQQGLPPGDDRDAARRHRQPGAEGRRHRAWPAVDRGHAEERRVQGRLRLERCSAARPGRAI